MPNLNILEADLALPAHQKAVVQLIDAYAQDTMGGGNPLSERVKSELIPGLRSHPTTIILLAYDGEVPVGIAACFVGFSTFAARPLLNIHDLAVLPSHRNLGVGRRLLEAVDAKARELGCCKVTLEVVEKNHRARHTYAAAGFAQATYGTEGGGTLFLTKPLA